MFSTIRKSIRAMTAPSKGLPRWIPSTKTSGNDKDLSEPGHKISSVIQGFLRDIKFEMPEVECDLKGMTRLVQAHFEAQQFSSEFIAKMKPIIECSAANALISCPFTDTETRELIGIYSTYIITIDDMAKEFTEDLKDFNTSILRGQKQKNKLLQCFVDFLAASSRSFGQFGGDMIIKSSIEFVNACYMEVEQQQQLLFPPAAAEFPRYLRLKTGVGEAFSFCIFPEKWFPEDTYLKYYLPIIPYLVNFFDLGNDILSFYKEFGVAGDSFNFIQQSARTLDLDDFQILQELCTKTVHVVQRIRNIAAVDSRLHASMDRLIQGYICFYLSQPRYRLSEIGISEAIEACRLSNVSQNQN